MTTPHSIRWSHLSPVLLVPLLGLVLSSFSKAEQPIAFPGAVGQGAAASGGRGGDVYHVTTLADYNPENEAKIPGSLRHAIRSAEGPRTIVFDVGGAIALHAPLKIFKSDLTIAGQTAPAPGITLWGYPVDVSKGSNVIVRFLRVRLGDFHARTAGIDKPHPYQGNNDLDAGSANAISIGGDGCHTVIFDHVSAAWGMDEIFSVTVCKDVTVQKCLIGNSLNDSFHPKGPHGFGSLVRGEVTPEDQAAGKGGYTFYQNLWAHNRGRNPSFGGQQNLDDGQSEADRRRTDVNLVNNVIYNWLGQPIQRSGLGEVRANVIGNIVICGPAKSNDRIFNENVPDKTFVFQTGNFFDSDQNSMHDIHLIAGEKQVAQAFREFDDADQLLGEDAEPFNFIATVENDITPAEAAYENVVATVGCSITRDAVDEQLIKTLTSRTGNLINSQEEFRDSSGKLAGIDDVPENHRPSGFDTDGDGMPDVFEKAHSLDPANPADGNATKLSDLGYTNLEVYINGLALQTE